MEGHYHEQPRFVTRVEIGPARFSFRWNRCVLKKLRAVARPHVSAWRKDMEARSLAPASIRHKLSGLSSLFNYLCERKRGARQARRWCEAACCEKQQRQHPALGDARARRLLQA